MPVKNTKEHTGQPSGSNKSEGLGMEGTPPEKMDEYLEETEKYTDGPDTLDPSVHVRHHNRNTAKGELDDDKGEKD